MNKRTQNYGVVVKAEEESGIQDYYGVLVDIVQLDYLGNHQVTLFKCDWYEGKSVQKDKYNCTSINISKPWKTTEPYVLATQAQQVFYVDDIKLGNGWKVVIQAQARNLWNVIENKDDECIKINESCQQNESDCPLIDSLQCHSDFVEWCRNDIPASSIEANKVKPAKGPVDTFIDDQEEEEEEEQEEEGDYTLDEYDDEEGEGEGEYNTNENEDDYEID